MFSSLALVLWIGVGTQIARPYVPKLAISTAGCNATDGIWQSLIGNVTSLTEDPVTSTVTEATTLFPNLRPVTTIASAAIKR